MHIAVLGPVNPPGLAGFMHKGDAEVAATEDGNYGTSLTTLVAGLMRSGHQVTVITHRTGLPRLHLEGRQLNYIRVDSRSNRRVQALDWWRRERTEMRVALEEAYPDVINAHWSYEWALASLGLEFPLVVTVHDAPLTILRLNPVPYRISRTLLAYWVRLNMSKQLVLAAPSPYLAQSWRRQMLWRRNCSVIPNPAPFDTLTNVEKSAEPLIVEIASGHKLKNVKALIQAMPIIREHYPLTKLRLIGPGLAVNDRLHRWAQRKGLAGGVEFLGPQSRAMVGHHLSEAWIHAHASLEESFGNTLVEAMQAGTAVLAGEKASAVPWVLRDGEAGVLVDVTSPRAISDAAIELISRSEKRSRLIEAGRNRVRTDFSLEAVVREHIAMYQSAIVNFERS